MSTKLNTNLNAVELTQAELESVTGGNAQQEQDRVWKARLSQIAASALTKILKQTGQDLKDAVKP
jgi:hypothetical protein